MQSVALFGPLDALLAGRMEFVILVLAVVNVATRALAHRQHVEQAAEGGAEALSRHPVHVASNVVLILAAFYFTTLQQHAGVVVSTLVVGMFLTDFFEFESRKVEARRDIEIERPKAAIAASGLVVLYAAFISLFFIVEPVWSAIV